jgi:hypothetical protein
MEMADNKIAHYPNSFVIGLISLGFTQARRE